MIKIVRGESDRIKVSFSYNPLYVDKKDLGKITSPMDALNLKERSEK